MFTEFFLLDLSGFTGFYRVFFCVEPCYLDVILMNLVLPGFLPSFNYD